MWNKMTQHCRFCKKTFGQCICEENVLGDYYNKYKDDGDPYGR